MKEKNGEKEKERKKQEKGNTFATVLFYFVYVTLKNYLASYRLFSVKCI